MDRVRRHWTDVFDGIKWDVNLQDRSAVESSATAMPEGARGIVFVWWKPKSDYNSHVFSFERTSQGVRFFDPQTGKDAVDNFTNGEPGLFRIARIDNLAISKWGARACVKATSGS